MLLKRKKNIKILRHLKNETCAFFAKLAFLRGARFLYFASFARFSAHIGASLYGAHTFAKLRRKLYVSGSFKAQVVFSKTQGFHASCALVQLAAKVKPAAKAKVATESRVHNLKKNSIV
jgi:hypothetical protein